MDMFVGYAKTDKNLEVHHIIPFSQCPEIVTLKMNGVTLCHSCHIGTDSYGKNYSASVEKSYGHTNTMMFVIPHNFQAYPTVGNYEYTNNGIMIIFISNMNNDDYHYLVFLHEYVESYLCKKRGISEKDITDFDLMFEKERQQGIWSNKEEPGDDLRCIYHKEHVFATTVEKMMVSMLGIKWDIYNSIVENL